MTAIKHGTTGGYTNRGCRCQECRDAQAAYSRAYKARRKAAGDFDHGTITAYASWGCRCRSCSQAMTRYQQDRRVP